MDIHKIYTSIIFTSLFIGCIIPGVLLIHLIFLIDTLKMVLSDGFISQNRINDYNEMINIFEYMLYNTALFFIIAVALVTLITYKNREDLKHLLRGFMNRLC